MNAIAEQKSSQHILTREELLKAYLKDGWKTVPGWLYDGALQLIRMIDIFQKSQGFKGHIGEIGLFQGKLFILLSLMAREEERVFGVDLFGKFQKEGDDRLSVILENMRQHMGEHPWVDILSSDSTLVTAAQLEEHVGGKYRIFSVDGSHEEDVVLHDLTIAAESLAPGGVILLDDYFDPGNPGVSVGTCRYFFQENSTLAPFAAAGNKLFLCDKNAHQAYFDQFCKVGKKAIRGTPEMFGYKVVVYLI